MSISKIVLPVSLLKTFQAATGNLALRELSDENVVEAARTVASIADEDSQRALLDVLPASIRSRVPLSIETKQSTKQTINTAKDMYWIYDTLVLSKTSRGLKDGLDAWLKPGGTDKLIRLGLVKEDFAFLITEETGTPISDEIFAERFALGIQYFTLLMKVAQSGLVLDNDIASRLFLIEFGDAFNNGQSSEPVKRYDRDSVEYKGFVNIAKKVLANPSGQLTV